MATATKLKVNFGFADDTKRTLELGTFDSADENLKATLKSRLEAFDPDAIKENYLSESGAKLVGIQSATLYKSEETDINLNGGE